MRGRRRAIRLPPRDPSQAAAPCHEPLTRRRSRDPVPQLGPRPKAQPGVIVKYRQPPAGDGPAAAALGSDDPRLCGRSARLIDPTLSLYKVEVEAGKSAEQAAAEISKVSGERAFYFCAPAAGRALEQEGFLGPGAAAPQEQHLPCIPCIPAALLLRWRRPARPSAGGSAGRRAAVARRPPCDR